MTDFLQWTLTLEVIGLACLPITFWLFRWLPDRGYGFAKLAGLLAITYGTWLAGSVVPVAGPPFVPVILIVLIGSLCWWWRGAETLATIRSLRAVFGVQEGLFLVALIVWSLMRAYVFHPGIGHTEQFMDLTLLNSSLRSSSFPPYDPWMSGHTVNYYYVGYLMYATLTKLSGVSVTIGYNLALSTVFAFTVGAAYTLVYNLSRRLFWAGLGPALVALVGNWHAVLVQLPQGAKPSDFYWFWGSTRVIARQAEGTANTINEFPFFSFMLGDLHPHVMALPVTLLAMALGINLVFCPTTFRLKRDSALLGRLALTALAVGSLFVINSWDLPAYLLLISICLGINAYLTDETAAWWRAPLATIPAVAVAAVLLWLPFYLHYRSPAHGIGLVNTPSNLGEFLQVFGVLLVPAVILLLTYSMVFRPADDDLEEVPAEEPEMSERPALEAGQARIGDVYLSMGGAGLVLLVLGIRFQLWTLDLILVIGVMALVMLRRVLNSDEPHRADAIVLALVLVACWMLALTETVYLKDEFDGGDLYRMNTVFKFYYEAWALLGIGGAYGVYRTWSLLRKHFAPGFGWGAIALVAVAIGMGGYYTVEAPQSASLGGLATSLDASALLREQHPSDAAAIAWLQTHTSGQPVVLEAVENDYDYAYARVSAYTGLPTVMGWIGHELQWRGADPQIAVRGTDANTIYTTTNPSIARSLLQKYSVQFVFVGDGEHALKNLRPKSLAKFDKLMRIAFRAGGTTVYRW